MFVQTSVLFAVVSCGFILPVAALLEADSLLKRLTPPEFAKAYLIGALIWIVVSLVLAALTSGIARLLRAPHLVAALTAAAALAASLVTFIYAARAWFNGQNLGTQGFPIWGTASALFVSTMFLAGAFTKRGAQWLRLSIPLVRRTLRAPALLFALLAAGCAFFGENDPAKSQPPHPYTASSPAAGAGARRPDIFLVTVDTLTARDMSLYGYHRKTTPNLERHAARFVVFDRFYANCNFTTCGIANLLSGRRPWGHRVQHMSGFFRSPERENNLATLLDAAGYRLGAFVANCYGQPRQLGVANAFDRSPPDYLGYVRSQTHDMLATFGDARAQDTGYLFPFVTVLRIADLLLIRSTPNWQLQTPDRQLHDALRFIDQKPAGRQPLFVWLHIYPPHHPYLPPPPFLHRFDASGKVDSGAEQQFGSGFYSDEMHSYVTALRARYDENIAYADDAVGRFLDALAARGRLENAVVVFGADHGESFEHGYVGHGGPLLHEPLIHIPFMIRAPGYGSGTRVTHIAEQIDLLPTLLELVSIPVPAHLEGHSLTPLLRGEPGAGDQTAFAMTLEESSAFGNVSRATIAMIDGRHKYIHYLGMPERRDELYDLAADPRESRNLRVADAARSAAMRRRIESQLHRMVSQPARLQ